MDNPRISHTSSAAVVLITLNQEMMQFLVYENTDVHLLIPVATSLATVEAGAAGARDLNRKIDEMSPVDYEWLYRDIFKRLNGLLLGVVFKEFVIDEFGLGQLKRVEEILAHHRNRGQR